MSDASLFASSDAGSEPLAARMRPRTLDEFVGQEHILGEGRLLRRAIQADMISSLIFYGPPGTGKTTLARVIANTTKSRFVSLNAVLAGVKDVREAIAEARENHELYGRRTILFVDEVHRWNKAQQDALLPWVENGTVVLIGATTQNPFFEVNSALVSRSRIFQLKTLTTDDLRRVVRRALDDPHRGYGAYDVSIDEDALEHLVAVADGDARALLGALQLAVETTPDRFPPEPGTTIHIDRGIAEDSIQQKAVLYDKEGDYHFDVISAFIKSIRGSDPDATLYWMAKMVHSGEAPHYIFRRMLISASEDVGLADPGALGVVESAAAAFDRVGLPEGNFHLAQAALYLATAPKSNSALGYFDALEAVAKEPQQDVPNHLRDANRDKEGFGHGEGYLYPHAYRDHWVAQAYLPSALQGRIFYEPSDQGYEADVAVRVARNRELQLELAIPEQTDEVLSFSPGADRRLAEWVRRAVEQRMGAAAELRDRATEALATRRGDRVLVAGRRATLHLWEAVRSAPEGRVVAVVPDARRAETARHYAGKLPEIERPLVVDADPVSALREDPVAGHAYERMLLADALAGKEARSALPAALGALCAPPTRLVVVQPLPARGQRISELVGGDPAIEAAEESLFSDPANALVNWDAGDLERSLADAGWTVETSELIESRETRYLAREQIDRWLDPDRPGGLGAALAAQSPADREAAAGLLRTRLAGKTVEWKTVFALLIASYRDERPKAGA
ncbi:MAG: AAA family ATPase [Spirochaetota bacterium]